MITVINNDCLIALKEFPDNYFSSVVTDPPYGLSFMNKHWDYDVPGVDVWREVLRCLKPGGYLLSFGGTRTYHRMVVNIEDAGFEIRDQMQWIYGSGFPKSLNVSKAIDGHFGAEREVVGVLPSSRVKASNSGFEMAEKLETKSSTPEAQQWDGWGTALKPANEPICVARKPLIGTVAENVLQHGTGGINIDGCRIDYRNEDDLNSATFGRGTNIIGGNYVGATHGDGRTKIPGNPQGRWPGNVIFSHHEDCELIGHKKIRGTVTGNGDAKVGEESNGAVKPMRRGTITDRTDEEGLETIEQWQCVDGCPVKALDEQTGTLKSGMMKAGTMRAAYTEKTTMGWRKEDEVLNDTYGDSGGASRFFYCAKASRSERNKGLEKCPPPKSDEGREHGQPGTDNPFNRGATEVTNNHPTVKPIALMRYLVRLVTPPGGIVLDPFAGTCTTGIGCKLEGFDAVMIEREKEHADKGIARVEAWKLEEPDMQLSLFV